MKHGNSTDSISGGSTIISRLIKQTGNVILVLSLMAFSGSLVMAAPPPPPPGVIVISPPPKPYRKGLHSPPAGKVWVEVMGRWILVDAPPEYGPYMWGDSGWIPNTSPVPNDAEWVPGHWTPRGWIPGHWRAFKASPPHGASWVPGHWEGNRWVQGHWQGSHPHGRKWQPGHHGSHGRWIPGHWR